MEGNRRQEAFDYLIDLSKIQGYLTFDEIIECVEIYNLPINEVDWLTNSITVRGILICENDPLEVDYNEDEYEDEYEDYAQSNYNELYDNIIRLDNSLEPFINEVRNIIPPQYGEVSQLKHLIKVGNEYARTRMIEMHLRLAVKIAYQNVKTYDMDIVETIGDACVGLIKAVDKYDPNTNDAFSSYASFWIFQNITRMYATQNPHIYFSYYKKEQYYALYPILKHYGCIDCKDIYNCSKITERVSDKLNCTYDEFKEIINSFIPFESYEVVTEGLQDSLDLNELYGSNKPRYKDLEMSIFDNNFEEILEYKFLVIVIDNLLDTLIEREKNILILRFGLHGETERTLEEIGEIYCLTRERIRQIESKALRKLRHPSRSRILNGYETF